MNFLIIAFGQKPPFLAFFYYTFSQLLPKYFLFDIFRHYTISKYYFNIIYIILSFYVTKQKSYRAIRCLSKVFTPL